jgi:hypothetical protein
MKWKLADHTKKSTNSRLLNFMGLNIRKYVGLSALAIQIASGEDE